METKQMMEQFIRAKMAAGLAQATIDSYCFALRDYLQWKTRNPDGIMEDYFIFLRGKQYSPVTLRDKYAVLHAFYNFYGIKIKMKKPALPKQRARCFTDEEINKILYSYNDRSTFTKLRDYTIICILLATGMRRNELLNIQSIQGQSIVVRGKGNKERWVPISSALRRVLKEYLPARAKIAIDNNLIIGKSGKRLTKDGLRAVFTRLSKETGISGRRFSAHTFRHTYATQSLKNGMDIASLQRILGHEDLATTALYLNWDDKTAEEANEKYNPLKYFNFF